MKRLLLYAVVSLQVLVIACRKDYHPDEDTPITEKYPISLDVSGFSHVVTDYDGRIVINNENARDSIEQYIHYIYYLVFNEYGGLVKTIRQDADDPDFGAIRDSLPAGIYKISVLGSKDPVVIGPEPLDYIEKFAIFSLPGTDVFFKQVQLSVNGPVSQLMSLDRIMAKLKVTIKDMIPMTAASLNILPGIYPRFPADANLPLPGALDLGLAEITSGARYSLSYRPYSLPITDSLRGKSNVSVEMYIVTLDTTRTSVDIACLSAGGDTLGAKTIMTADLIANKKTVLSGNLFDNTGVGDTVKVVISNPEWKPDSIYVEF
ncbi:hypothetical protein [Chitinophaga agri]|uniref:Uncharacterized protein n=1 Tax=Chitinophaga agri TaxID=2703787 RepID=A0A6B9Z8P9_9BACT|nr:hypothetical protein [Chitinophaga agri]QHS58249.1 hypothetical protein GWR21_01155 [Chitinophaga agri]